MPVPMNLVFRVVAGLLDKEKYKLCLKEYVIDPWFLDFSGPSGPGKLSPMTWVSFSPLVSTVACLFLSF